MEILEINKVFDDLANAQISSYLAAETAGSLNAKLKFGKAQALLDGKIEGKNEEMREAAARTVFYDLYAQVDQANAELRLSAYKLTQAQIAVDRITWTIRYLETVQPAPKKATRKRV